MIKLGITGNIACGKSIIGEYLQSLNYPVIDSDFTVHQILSSQNTITKKILELTNNSILSGNAENYINRLELGKLVFTNTELKKQIENIIHPEVLKKTLEFFDIQEQQNKPLAINLIPLLFEINAQSFYDYTWLIFCDTKVQEERFQKRNPNFTKEEIKARLNAQIPQNEKRGLVNFVIDNSHSLEYTYSQVHLALKKILS